MHLKAVPGQSTLYDTYRFRSFFTTMATDKLDAVVADKIHRKHGRIDQVNAGLKESAVANLPSGKFVANSTWLVATVMAYNLTRTTGVLTHGQFTKTMTGTIRAKLINVQVRIASSARRQQFQLPHHWPWQTEWENLFNAAHVPPQAA